ncbi:granulocyte colony-stimulating factor receptor [Hyla sarda]|uniref:granulocyte colony-stimulating factor receptor n=1 Tax=Hyla sarda TaxID=327740 RepID=UPI0024C29FC3|nr:granulocyte colony-stimulating factor receptor [Hyla sarda]
MLFLDSLGVKTKDMYKNQGVLLLLLFVVQGAQSCHITVDSSIIPIGSPLSASCDCPHLGNGKYEVIWKLDEDFVPCNLSSNAQTSTCSAYIASFNKTSGLLQCYVSSSEGLQLVDQVTISAGYPPAPPTNISCLTNIHKNIVNCTWQLQKHSLLEENVTLSTFKSSNKCSTHLSSEYICNPSKGEHFCNISRKYFDNFGELSVQVIVQNKIGSATSSRLCVVPLQEVKLDPIVIKDTIPHKDCVTLQWTYGRKAEFLKDMRCQFNYRKAAEMEWTGPIEVPVDVKTIDQCGLVGGIKYDFQIRCIRKNLTGQWSEWGPTTNVTTVETIPTGKLETWWRILEPTHDSPEKIQLLWKPLERNKANAEHLWYIVKSSLDETDTILCNTTSLNCTISLPTEKKNVFIWTYNNAGASPESQITFTARNGTPVSKIEVSSNGDSSLKVMWEPQSSAKSYLLEWHKNTELSDCEIHWRVEQEGKRSSILQDIQPYQRYSVRLYPLYKDCIGMAIEIDAYSKEGAPDYSPDITLITVNKSQAAVQWKPIPVQRSNGFINYTVFWTETSGKEHSATLDGSATKYIITNLLPSTTYQVLLSSSTSEGSVNGTGLMLHTAAADNEDINMMLLIFILFGFFIIIVMVLTCIMKHERMKNRFWPVVPDPANSQMGKRVFFLEKTPEMTFDISDVSQINTSELRIVEGWKEKNLPLENGVKDNCFEDYGLACNTQTSSSPEDPNKPKYYINVDTVQYAKVITEGYREQSPPTSVYVRSDSTQPLLCDVSPSPQNYENTWFHFSSHEDSVFLMEEETLKDFPLLNALQLHED